MPQISGGCLCGKVRYEAEAEPLFMGVCHCSSCQKQAGSAFGTSVAVPRQALSILGTLKTYAHTGGSGKAVHRRFCPDCGSPVITEADALPDVVIIKAGTLDDTSWLKPTTEICCADAQPWVQLGGGMERFAGSRRRD